MRVVLLSTPTRTYAPNYIVPTGIMSLAAWLEKHGHQVKIVDAAALRESNDKIIERVKEFNPDLVGVGGIITAYSYIIALTHDIKAALPKVPIVLGGQVVINNVDLCYEHMVIDYIIHGYGEIALEKLVRHLEGTLEITRIPGVCYRLANGKIVENPGREFFNFLDEMPLPAYHLIDMEHYATVNGNKLSKLQKYMDQTGKSVVNHRFVSVMGTLGCTDRCTFCVHEQEFVGLKVFSNEYLLRHMEFLHKTYNIHVFSIGEEMFLTTVKRAAAFNELMKLRLPNCYWYASTRGNHVTPELIKVLEDGNCYSIAWGFESASQKMLDLMKKRMTRKANIEAFYNLDHSKIVASASMMVGNVGEDRETILDSVSGVHEAGLYASAVFFASAYPGGRAWDWAVEQGIIKDRHEYLMAASNVDAAARINVNLTPYPDFILKAWQKMLMWALHQEGMKKKVKMHRKKLLRYRAKDYLKLMLGFYLVPPPWIRYVVDAYFIYYRFSRKFFQTAKDRQYAFGLESDGAFKVKNLIVGDIQRAVPPEKLAQLHEKALARKNEAAAQPVESR